MFKRWNVYYYYKLMGQVVALTQSDALYKGEILTSEITGIARSTSKYSGLNKNKLEVKMVL